MSGADGWSSVPRRHPANHGDAGVGSGQEARGASPTSPAGPANGRPQGRPAPGYGEYAPEGWVNPVLVEQERQERQDRERQDQAKAVGGRDAAPRDSVRTDHARPDARSGAAPAGVQRTMPRSRFGRTPADFVLTVGLLAFGLVSVVQSLSVGDVASTVRRTLETQYTALNDPSALSTAAVIAAITNVVVFALVAWWSIRRLRARKRTFWVPLVGAVVATAISTIAFVVVVLQDQAFVDFMLRQSGA
ncbi:hypothetical protein BIU95_05185 [Curtobacterium sp. MCBA15_007]|uniref:Uncharacterized protein n=1 Tax=Curtobacterium flaccumfaciens pv. flaccumfaciens TaxID=138532 RepID=A0A9Q2ZRJ5_9MICO|nr:MULTISPECIES: DUF6264 family protein [Curtobacterium]MBT1543637.1 hypothetical protein [Curtobacterium flaccumfaciens pv. flaccumfaciens]MCU0151685.1 DUF6264 family protein [Curtobacterium flaccumfaciens pv. poinsettiae]MDD1384222.1 DUF6264 family protein [Curtobacterium flaccumfaciens pv. poinsettiae]OII03113.1 hypothetical protein BIU95_05185 [Curtobacterium sp. MCBA15_007]UXN16311.1 DUF6264 family protein [Curtobacterium flaccumfaciens pv. poinsettiae]